jgi:hypothetical protein
MSLISKWAAFFRGAPPQEPVAQQPQTLDGLFERMARKQMERPRDEILNPYTGEALNFNEVWPPAPPR